MDSKENPVQVSEVLQYYPSQKYVDKNLKGENVPLSDLVALATAQRKAEQVGVLSPEVARYMLANALVEGRFSKASDKNMGSISGDFGVRDGNVFHGANANVKTVINALGIGEETKPPIIDDATRTMLNTAFPGKSSAVPVYNKTDVVMKPSEKPEWNATLATAILGIKSRESTDAEDAIRRWNGSGKGAENHLKKVQEAHRMLQDPKNAAVLQAYQKALLGGN